MRQFLFVKCSNSKKHKQALQHPRVQCKGCTTFKLILACVNIKQFKNNFRYKNEVSKYLFRYQQNAAKDMNNSIHLLG